MSSFNINGPSHQPIIQGAQNLGQDGGGGGNTGYMNMRGKKKGEDEKKDEENSVFLEEGEDTFTKEGKKEDKTDKDNKKSGKFLRAIKDLLKDKNEDNKDKDSFVRSTEDNSAPKEETKPFAYEDLQNEVPKIFKDADSKYNDNYYNDVDL